MFWISIWLDKFLIVIPEVWDVPVSMSKSAVAFWRECWREWIWDSFSSFDCNRVATAVLSDVSFWVRCSIWVGREEGWGGGAFWDWIWMESRYGRKLERFCLSF